jgi:hypothetical protein
MRLDTNTTNTRETYRFLSEHGWLRFYVFYIMAVPCAFLAGQLYNNNFYCQCADYHPKYTQFSVGSPLTSRAFEELAADGVQRVDLGEGGQEHNRRLGCQMSEEGTCTSIRRLYAASRWTCFLELRKSSELVVAGLVRRGGCIGWTKSGTSSCFLGENPTTHARNDLPGYHGLNEMS